MTSERPFALVVEDDHNQAEIFAHAMRDAGFATDICVNGDAAMSKLAAETPDVIVLDLHLPGTSGEQILTYVRGEERLAAAKVILATADGYLGDLLESQAALVLLKPVGFMQLRDLASRLRQGLPGS